MKIVNYALHMSFVFSFLAGTSGILKAANDPPSADEDFSQLFARPSRKPGTAESSLQMPFVQTQSEQMSYDPERQAWYFPPSPTDDRLPTAERAALPPVVYYEPYAQQSMLSWPTVGSYGCAAAAASVLVATFSHSWEATTQMFMAATGGVLIAGAGWCCKAMSQQRVMWDTRQTLLKKELFGNKKDRRKQVDTTESQSWPYQGHGWLQMEFPKGTDVGTGTLVGDDKVITAAHNVYDRVRGERPTRILFGIGNKNNADGSLPELIPISQGTAVFNPDYARGAPTETWSPQPSDIRAADLAMLTLQTPLGERYGHLGFGRLPNDFSQVNVSGYPADPEHHETGKIMYTMAGNHKGTEEGRIFYDLDTTKGQSGSGVWIQIGPNDKDYRCVGVHTYGRDPNSSIHHETRFNSATYLAEEGNARLLNRWLQA